MRDLRVLDAYRIVPPGFARGGATEGFFRIPSPTGGAVLAVIATAAHGWDHVSVSLSNRCPNWPEMCRVKGLFFRNDETVMQLHVPAAEHVNNHDYCLHLWRPHGQEIPRPPSAMVGVRGVTPAEVAAMSREQKLAFLDTHQVGGAL